MSLTSEMLLIYTATIVGFGLLIGLPVLIFAGTPVVLAAAAIALPIAWFWIGLFRLVGGPE